MIGVYLDKPNDRGAAYTFRTIFSILGTPFFFLKEDSTEKPWLLISYGSFGLSPLLQRLLSSGIPIISIPCHETMSSIKGVTEVIPNSVPEVTSFIIYGDERVPLFYPYLRFREPTGRTLYNYEDGTPAIREKEGQLIELGFDIVASCFYLITCGEEELILIRDRKRRFNGKHSRRNFNELLRQATVDLYIKLLKELLIILFKHKGLPVAFKCPWPNGKRFAAFLSHDVDGVYKREFYSIVSKSKRALRKMFSGSLGGFLHDLSLIAKTINQEQNPYWNFDRWKSLEDRFGFRSTFYFLGGRKVGRYGRRYSIESLKQEIQQLAQEGWEIGMHGSYYSYRNSTQLEREKSNLEGVLGDKVYGNRQHYLRFDPRRSYQDFEGVGLMYDASLGYDDKVGWRGGISFPFRPYDKEKGTERDIIEIPLGIMDGILFGKEALSPDASWNILQNMIEKTIQNSGCISLVWHQRVLDETDFPGWGDLYIQALKMIKTRNGWVATGKQIAEWIEKRERFCFIYEYNFESKTFQIETQEDWPDELALEIIYPDNAGILVGRNDKSVVKGEYSIILGQDGEREPWNSERKIL